jgi:hypothetical protein
MPTMVQCCSLEVAYKWLVSGLEVAWKIVSHFDRCRATHLTTFDYAWLRLPSLDAAWLHLDILVKVPTMQQYQSFWAVRLSGASANSYALAFYKQTAETLRAQPFPLFFVRLLVGPNWHRGASLNTLAYTWRRLTMLRYRYHVSIGTFRPPVTLDARYGICELPQERSDEDGRANSISASPLDYVCLRLDIDIAFRSLYIAFQPAIIPDITFRLLFIVFRLALP